MKIHKHVFFSRARAPHYTYIMLTTNDMGRLFVFKTIPNHPRAYRILCRTTQSPLIYSILTREQSSNKSIYIPKHIYTRSVSLARMSRENLYTITYYIHFPPARRSIASSSSPSWCGKPYSSHIVKRKNDITILFACVSLLIAFRPIGKVKGKQISKGNHKKLTEKCFNCNANGKRDSRTNKGAKMAVQKCYFCSHI